MTALDLPSLSLTEKTILISGASSGLGHHFARLSAASGAQVVAAARRTEALEELVSEIETSGGTAHPVSLDVTDPASCRACVEEAIAKFGRIDVLVNNAGVTATEPAMEVDAQAWRRVIDTNQSGVWSLTHAVAPFMRDAGGGTIVNIASILGKRVAGGVLAYTVSKAAVIQMTKALALEWARHNIRVNALAPGYIETDINSEFFDSPAGQSLIKRIPQRRLGRVEELDAPFLLLASEASSFMTGSVLAVDGGHLVSSL